MHKNKFPSHLTVPTMLAFHASSFWFRNILREKVESKSGSVINLTERYMPSQMRQVGVSKVNPNIDNPSNSPRILRVELKMIWIRFNLNSFKHNPFEKNPQLSQIQSPISTRFKLFVKICFYIKGINYYYFSIF